MKRFIEIIGAKAIPYKIDVGNFTEVSEIIEKIVQDFSTNGAYTWVPRAADVGTHRLQVAVRNAESSSPGDDFAITEYFQVAP
jgi:hypothetical protein